jgi:hypothetical protein
VHALPKETMSFDPKLEIKKTGNVTAEFKGAKTPENLAEFYVWIKEQKWKGCLELNFVGNGGVNGWIFREAPIKLAETELPY